MRRFLFALPILMGIVSGNFIAASCYDPIRWDKAVERSFGEFIAVILTTWIIGGVYEKLLSDKEDT
jgi:hypothetical protein